LEEVTEHGECLIAIGSDKSCAGRGSGSGVGGGGVGMSGSGQGVCGYDTNLKGSEAGRQARGAAAGG
jgi:hypothetical protein